MSLRSWTIWTFSAFFYAYQYILRVMPNVFMSDLTEAFSLDPAQFGQFAGIYYTGYTLSHIPIGIALDRFGPKYTVPICSALCILGILPMIYADNFTYVIAGRFLLGAGSTCAALGMFKVMSMICPEDKFIRMFSLAATLGLLGAVFGGSPLHYLRSYFPWQEIMLIFVVCGICLTILMFFIFPKLLNKSQASPKDDLLSIMGKKWIWIVAIGGGCLIGPLEGYSDAWAMQSLVDLYHVSTDVASHGSSLIFLSFAVGLLFIDKIVKKFGIDETVMMAGGLLFVAFVIVISGLAPLWLVPVALFGIGFASSYQVPAVCGIVRFVPHEMTSLAFAVANMIMLMFGTFYHTIIGNCIRTFGSNAIMNQGICHYDQGVYQKGFIIIPIMLLVGIALFAYVRVHNKDKSQL